MYAWNHDNKRGPFRSSIPRTIAREIRERMEEQENLAKELRGRQRHLQPPSYPRPSPHPLVRPPPAYDDHHQGHPRGRPTKKERFCQVGSLVRASVCLFLMLGVTGGLIYWIYTAHFASIQKEVHKRTFNNGSLEETALKLDKNVRLYIDYEGKLHRLSELEDEGTKRNTNEIFTSTTTPKAALKQKPTKTTKEFTISYTTTSTTTTTTTTSARTTTTTKETTTTEVEEETTTTVNIDIKYEITTASETTTVDTVDPTTSTTSADLTMTERAGTTQPVTTTTTVKTTEKVHIVTPETESNEIAGIEPRTLDIIDVLEEDEPMIDGGGVVTGVENEGTVKLIGDDVGHYYAAAAAEEATTEPYFFSNEVVTISTAAATAPPTNVNQTGQINRAATLLTSNYSSASITKPINQLSGIAVPLYYSGTKNSY